MGTLVAFIIGAIAIISFVCLIVAMVVSLWPYLLGLLAILVLLGFCSRQDEPQPAHSVAYTTPAPSRTSTAPTPPAPSTAPPAVILRPAQATSSPAPASVPAPSPGTRPAAGSRPGAVAPNPPARQPDDVFFNSIDPFQAPARAPRR